MVQGAGPHAGRVTRTRLDTFRKHRDGEGHAPRSSRRKALPTFHRATGAPDSPLPMNRSARVGDVTALNIDHLQIADGRLDERIEIAAVLGLGRRLAASPSTVLKEPVAECGHVRRTAVLRDLLD